ncbi:SDR family NAD(P)-dependent oxidoreductase [Demequina sp. NBRC 110054]|uniref:SDR family NAD(P)-dependent oxidoreductase n=1 Tax=Demequina sp. NBRC 110054 TaxID=1570343 RepID=UPI0009FE4380|nr:SDR family NAD(P)-dependent oxidoreductase [Demequina sp. NBRC 110054]
MATIAITGANSGIGLRAARRLGYDGHRVLALCRSVDRARAALGPDVAVVETHMDDLDSVEAAAARLSSEGVDVLINSAAVFDLGMKTREVTPAGFERVWATNHLGPAALAARLMPTLARSSDGRAVFIASKGLLAMPRLGIRWDELDGSGWYTPTKAYYHAKLAQVMVAETLAEQWGGEVSVSCLRVPAVRLDADKLAAQPAVQRFLYAPKNRAAAPPEEIAEAYERLAVGRRPEGVYVDESLEACALPRFARDAGNRARLASVTEEAIGVPLGRV